MTKSQLIDRFPFTNGQYRHFMAAEGYRRREFWSDEGWAWKEKNETDSPPLFGNSRYNSATAPVVGITWYEAEACANWSNKQLPTEDQWERAARGDDDARTYPWGDTFASDQCNTGENTIRQPTPAGSYPTGISPYGCYDMVGNVWEWTRSDSDSFQPFRGGSWGYAPQVARCAFRFGVQPDLRHDRVGFRLSRTL